MQARARLATRTRAILLGAALVTGLAGALIAFTGADTPAPHPVASLAQRLGTRTWALAIPTSWLVAPIPDLRDDDVLDLLGTRAGERATATDVASGLRVVTSDERILVVELTDEDASAIATARARGLSLVPILRSSR